MSRNPPTPLAVPQVGVAVSPKQLLELTATHARYFYADKTVPGDPNLLFGYHGPKVAFLMPLPGNGSAEERLMVETEVRTTLVNERCSGAGAIYPFAYAEEDDREMRVLVKGLWIVAHVAGFVDLHGWIPLIDRRGGLNVFGELMDCGNDRIPVAHPGLMRGIEAN